MLINVTRRCHTVDMAENDASHDSGNAATNEVEAFIFGKLAMADGITRQCTDVERRERMARAVELFAKQLQLAEPGEALRELQRRSLRWGSIERRMLLVDLWAVQPFSPFDVKVPSDDQRAVLQDIASSIDAGGAIGEIDRCARELRNSSMLKSATKVGGVLAAGALVLGGAGFVAAPFIGAALASGSGLSGAAATSAGLAALGGGSLAAGGSGVAGGIFLVTATGAAVGGLAGGGGAAMYQLGSRQAQVELRKMEIKFKVALLNTQGEIRVAQLFATHLNTEIDELRTTLENERLYSEKRSRRITSLEEILERFERSQKWMHTELDEAAS